MKRFQINMRGKKRFQINMLFIIYAEITTKIDDKFYIWM